MYCLVVANSNWSGKERGDNYICICSKSHFLLSTRSPSLMPCFWLCQHNIMCPIICVKLEDVDVCHQVLIFMLLHSVTLINYIFTFCPIFSSPTALMLSFLTSPCSQTLHAGTINVYPMLNCTVQENMQSFTWWKIASHKRPSIWRSLGLKLHKGSTQHLSISNPTFQCWI